ncbi:MAG: peptidase, partial [Thaumarchaeota archaeon]|nr:peptidase [Nitrososphaerota archaeon]
NNPPASIFGISLSETDGFAVPSSSGLEGFSNGNEKFSECSGTPSGFDHNNVVRNPKRINTNSGIMPGQIGLVPDAWPLVQLFSFSDVVIRYNPGTGVQKVDLKYGEIPNISAHTDRNSYPQNSHVFLTIRDVQLNQDPTDEDSWTFDTGTPNAVFYDVFDRNGIIRNHTLADLYPHLSEMGFDDNGVLSISAGKILEFGTNSEQPQTLTADGRQFSQVVTISESGRNSGIFDTADYSDESLISVRHDAPRGHAASISYNDDTISLLTGAESADISLGRPSLVLDVSGPLLPGTKIPIILVDGDQNLNSGIRETLDVFRSTAIIPTLHLGYPITLGGASGVEFSKNESAERLPIPSSTPDENSSRLFLDTSGISGEFEKLSFRLGVTASELNSILLSSNAYGTNWINYDFRSLEKNLNITDFSDTSIVLFIGSADMTPDMATGVITDVAPVRLADSGSIRSSLGTILLDDEIVRQVSDMSGEVFVVINFDDSKDSPGILSITNNTESQMIHPIVLDFSSFGLDSRDTVNNSVYRFELEETGPDTSTFVGEMEFAVANQINIIDPLFAQSIITSGDKIKFIIVGGTADNEDITISYSDLSQTGVMTNISSNSDVVSSSGRLTLDSDVYRFGQPVWFTLEDQDLNQSYDSIDVYYVIDDPASPGVDTVGSGGSTLLEILIKDIRYKRCTIDGVEHGGLAASGFSLVETSVDSGIFEGVFKMPSRICNESGTKLISSAGGSLDAKYYDYRDASGNSNIFSLSKNTLHIPLHLDTDTVLIPPHGDSEEIVLSGSVSDYKRNTPLVILLIHPDNTEHTFTAKLASNGEYRAIFTVTSASIPGIYDILLTHDGISVGDASFTVSHYEVRGWVRDVAELWSESAVSDSEFLDGLGYVASQGAILLPTGIYQDAHIPSWVKITTGLWSGNQINDREFLGAIQFLVKEGIIRI